MSERKCRRCGCTDRIACPVAGGTCSWVEEDLCSRCATPEEIEAAQWEPDDDFCGEDLDLDDFDPINPEDL